MTSAMSPAFNLAAAKRPPFLSDKMCCQKHCGFTLVELMVAMCVSLMLLGGVVSLFGTLGESVNDSKSNSEMLQTVRHSVKQLQSDLGNVSLIPDPAQTRINPQGFFEYTEGPFNDIQAYSDEPQEVELPDPVVVDNEDSGFTAESTSKLANTSGAQGNRSYNNKVHRAYSKYMKGIGQWTKTGLANGTYRVSITWPTEWNTSNWASKHETNVPITISSGDDTQSVAIDQSQIPSDSIDPELVDGKGNALKWHHLGELGVTNGKIVVAIGPCGQGYPGGKFVFADAIRIECLELTGGGAEDDAATAEMPLVGDCDDVLHFTTKTDDGAHEVVWFLTPMEGHENKPVADRRYRLHRVIRAIRPSATAADDRASAIPIATLAKNDQTVRQQADDPTSMEKTPSSLQDLALRENRFAHEKRYEEDGFTIRDTTGASGIADCFNVVTAANYGEQLKEDSRYMDDINGTETPRETGEQRLRRTVVLENVIAFDVQAYDPKAPIYSTTASDETTVIPLVPTDPGYSTAIATAIAGNKNPDARGTFVDLGYRYDDANTKDISNFSNSASGNVKQDADGNTATRAYDSWCGDYVTNGDVGFDNNGDTVVDTAEDLREKPPYDNPLKAVQVEIRVQEPESGKVRSVKVRKYLGKR